MTAHAETFDAIGVANTVVVDAESALEPALAIARAEVDALDRACSRFRDDSELSAVNRAAGADAAAGPLLSPRRRRSARPPRGGGLVSPTVVALRALG
jgi:thiamine biosynthesis lipoprotein